MGRALLSRRVTSVLPQHFPFEAHRRVVRWMARRPGGPQRSSRARCSARPTHTHTHTHTQPEGGTPGTHNAPGSPTLSQQPQFAALVQWEEGSPAGKTSPRPHGCQSPVPNPANICFCRSGVAEPSVCSVCAAPGMVTRGCCPALTGTAGEEVPAATLPAQRCSCRR